MTRSLPLTFFGALLMLQCGVCHGDGRFDLARDAKPLAAVVLSAHPAPEERQAADEIKNYVHRISGAALEVRTAGGDMNGLKPVFIGGAADASLADLIGKDKDPASFALVVKPDAVSIRGLSPEGTLFGAYELIEHLGVRWFMPGEIGTVVPTDRSPSLGIQQTVQSPSFAARWHSGSRKTPWIGEWQTRMRMGGPRFPSSHGINLGPDGSFQQHPEYYALINGVRTRKQLCVSNPEVIRLAAANLHDGWNGMGPNDSRGFCECANCRALDAGDFDPYVNLPSMTDRYIWFFNRVLEAAKARCPDAKIGFYAYDAYMRPPVREKPNPRIVPAIAPITLCRIHGVNNPLCPEKSYLLTLYKRWKQLCPEVYDRGYWFNLADMGLPFSMVSRLRDDIPAAKKAGIKGWRVETSAGSECHWASESPSLYIAAKLMWDSDADVDALLADFYEKFFGPAAAPMKGYFETMDAALRDADYHTGSMYDMPHIYSPGVRNKAGGYLDQAKRLAGSGGYAKRVEIFRLSFDYLEEFIQTVDRAHACDFAAANEHKARVQQIMTTLQSYDPPMLAGNKFPERFLDGFCGRFIDLGLAKTSKPGELAAALGDQWDFFQDPGNVGRDLQLWRPGCGGTWQKIKAYSLSWGDQGLRYYHGAAWYRQTVTIPDKFAGKRLVLWFGGITEQPVGVWLNGTELQPAHAFEYDVTSLARPGQANTLVTCVKDEGVEDLGVRGIIAPVMFYAAPADDASRSLSDPKLRPRR